MSEETQALTRIEDSEQYALERLSVAEQALAEAANIDEVKDIRDKAEAIRLYYAQQRGGLSMQNKAAELKLKAERKLGAALAAMDKNEGELYRGSTLEPRGNEPTYDELGIGKTQAHRWQTIAEVPDEQFTEYVAKCNENAEEVTSAGVYKLGRTQKKEQAKAEIQAKASDTLPPSLADRVRIIHAPIDTLAEQIEPDSVDAIVTDPPYPREYIPLYSELAKLAAYALKPGGSLLAMCGQSYLPEIIPLLTQHLEYRWTLAYMTPGATLQVFGRKVLTGWKPLLWLTKGEYAGEWLWDVCRSDKPDKDHHGWGQSESGFADMIERVTLPGQLVLDPFVGGGTAAVVALSTQRCFIGADSDEDAIRTTLGRLEVLYGKA